jgi:SNF2 family DNA or RNA helicase
MANMTSFVLHLLFPGTPIQNNLGELYAVMQVIRPHALGTARQFKTRFEQPIERGQSKDALGIDIKRAKVKA